MYCGTVHLNRSEDETWLMPIGLLLDLWACHMQFLGRAKPRVQLTIDDIIPYDV